MGYARKVFGWSLNKCRWETLRSLPTCWVVRKRLCIVVRPAVKDVARHVHQNGFRRVTGRVEIQPVIGKRLHIHGHMVRRRSLLVAAQVGNRSQVVDVTVVHLRNLWISGGIPGAGCATAFAVMSAGDERVRLRSRFPGGGGNASSRSCFSSPPA